MIDLNVRKTVTYLPLKNYKKLNIIFGVYFFFKCVKYFIIIKISKARSLSRDVLLINLFWIFYNSWDKLSLSMIQYLICLENFVTIEKNKARLWCFNLFDLPWIFRLRKKARRRLRSSHCQSFTNNRVRR